MKSQLESDFLSTLKMMGIEAPEREVKLIPGRRFRVDFYWPRYALAAEVDGGTWVRGRHVRANGFESDARKGNLLALRGIRWLRFTAEMVRSFEAARTIKEALDTCGTKIP